MNIDITKQIIEDGENGTIEDVLVAPVGDFIGSKRDGEAIEQHFTPEALAKIADDLNSTGEEVLLDKDHASAREGLTRDTQALGWLSKFKATLFGLFAKLKLTKAGREMIGGREYRHVSPVFRLSDDNTPIQLLSVAATNTPAIDIPENIILNTEPKKDEVEQMTKEELKTFIMNTVAEMKEAAEKEEVKEEIKEEVIEATEETETKPDNETETKEEIIEEVKEEVKDECPDAKSECSDETKNEPPEKKTEVIQEEALNQTSTTTIPTADPVWKNLTGEEFRKWCETHPQGV